eukprot:Clim_evm89s210 gene=Clim_evmTU89s210
MSSQPAESQNELRRETSQTLRRSSVLPKAGEPSYSFLSKPETTVSDDQTSGSKSKRPARRLIYTQGRPPWYTQEGQTAEAFIIGVCGGSASGKTTVAKEVIERLGIPWVVLLSMDSFYKVLSPEESALAAENKYNFDHPNAFDLDLVVETLEKLKKGKKVQIPEYDFRTHSRRKGFEKTLYGANVVIFEGILTFVDPRLRDLLDLKVFVNCDSDIRLARRLKRDIVARGRDIEGVFGQYYRYVKPCFEEIILPSVKHADIIVSRGIENKVAIDLIVEHVRTQLNARGYHFRDQLKMVHQRDKIPDNVYVLKQTPQVQAMQVIIRNRDSSRDDFVFYSRRLIRLMMEYTVSLLPVKPRDVTTPTGCIYHGVSSVARVTGVTIMRAGATMEGAFREVLRKARIGKILIQTNPETGDPELHYNKLPKDINQDQVILMDATAATGAAAIMAIRVLLDHDVKEEHIIFVTIIAAPTGVQSIAYAFPKVRIVCAAIDREVNSSFHILPGIGNFGDRFYGT